MIENEDMRFRAMGSDAHVVVVGAPSGLLEYAHARIAELEQRWSRFIDSSDVCALRRDAGEWVTVSDDTVRLVELAVEGWRLSGGGFDPLVLDAVERAGYDRTFDAIDTRGVLAGAHETVRPSAFTPMPTAIGITTGQVRLPAGCAFDPGGIGKGLAADKVVADLIGAGAAGACVNLGGDLRVAGRAPEGGDWTIAVEDPWSRDAIVDVGLRDGAVATSSTQRRRWTLDGVPRHHLIDPATGEPSTSDLVAVTVIAGAGWMAEVLAKAALLRGAERWCDVLPAGVEGLAVDRDGGVLATPGLIRFTHPFDEPHESFARVG
ncbi:MAG TPA: FAD:protein FMN transferase [Acidimicrobiia bacterium]